MPVTWAARAFVVSRLMRIAVACLLGFGALSAAAQTVTRPLTSLRAPRGAAAPSNALIIELSAREALSGVHLQIASDAEPETGARYVVWVNGAQVTQVDAKSAIQTIALSPEHFVPGSNSIQLARVPHSATVTGRAAYSDVAHISDAHSSITLDFAGLRPNQTPTLAQLPLAFDARTWMPRNVTVVLGREPPSPQQLRAAALAVGSIAARMPQVAVTAAYEGGRAIVKRNDPDSWAIDKNAARAGDVLVVGTRKALADALPASITQIINGPFLGVYPANDGKSVVVVLSGITEIDCLHAAQAFADTSTEFPARTDMTLDPTTAIHGPPAHLAVSLEKPDSALVRAALNFAAIRARATGVLVDFAFMLPSDVENIDLFFGSATSLDARVLRQLPAFPVLQPGQVVSLEGHSGGRPFVAVLGSSDASVAHAVDMLRQSAVWSVFAHGATLFDTTSKSAKPLTVAERSSVARVRLLLADPVMFCYVLTALLVLSYIFLNITLKEQVDARFDPTCNSDRPPK